MTRGEIHTLESDDISAFMLLSGTIDEYQTFDSDP
jgi:hypothetical protein